MWISVTHGVPIAISKSNQYCDRLYNTDDDADNVGQLCSERVVHDISLTVTVFLPNRYRYTRHIDTMESWIPTVCGLILSAGQCLCLHRWLRETCPSSRLCVPHSIAQRCIHNANVGTDTDRDSVAQWHRYRVVIGHDDTINNRLGLAE